MKGKRGGVGYVLCIDDDNSDCFGCVVKKKRGFFLCHDISRSKSESLLLSFLQFAETLSKD